MSFIAKKSSEAGIQLNESELLGWSQVENVSGTHKAVTFEDDSKNLARLLNKRSVAGGEMPPVN